MEIKIASFYRFRQDRRDRNEDEKNRTHIESFVVNHIFIIVKFGGFSQFYVFFHFQLTSRVLKFGLIACVILLICTELSSAESKFEIFFEENIFEIH